MNNSCQLYFQNISSPIVTPSLYDTIYRLDFIHQNDLLFLRIYFKNKFLGGKGEEGEGRGKGVRGEEG